MAVRDARQAEVDSTFSASVNRLPLSEISGAIAIGLLGGAVLGPVGALIGMLVGGLTGRFIHRRATSEAR